MLTIFLSLSSQGRIQHLFLLLSSSSLSVSFSYSSSSYSFFFQNLMTKIAKTVNTFFLFSKGLSINGENRPCLLWWWYPVSGLLLWSSAQAFTAQHQDRLPELRVRGWLHRHSLPGLEIQTWKERRPTMASGVLRLHERKSRIDVQLAETSSRNARHPSVAFSDAVSFRHNAHNCVGILYCSTGFCHRFHIREFAASRRHNM